MMNCPEIMDGQREQLTPQNSNTTLPSPAHQNVHCVSNNHTASTYCNFDIHQPISIIFVRNVAKKESSQMTLYFPTSPN